MQGNRRMHFQCCISFPIEPISVTIIGMHELFDEDFWTMFPEYVDTGYCKKSWNRTDTWNNILKAMKGYATWKQISASHGMLCSEHQGF